MIYPRSASPAERCWSFSFAVAIWLLLCVISIQFAMPALSVLQHVFNVFLYQLFTCRRVFDLKLFSWIYVQHPHVSLCQITRRQVTSTQPCSIDVSTVPWRYSVGTKLLRKLWTNNETGTYCIWFKYRIYIYRCI